METHKHIITVGISPAWDITCRADGLEWGDHTRLDSQTVVPAGKALNISRALAWMGVPSTAAGLWGQADYDAMRQALTDPNIDIRMTPVPGQTRQNITVIDTRAGREMHLRAACALATPRAIEQLAADLEALMSSPCIVIFSGSLPEDERMTQILSLIRKTAEQGAKIILDTGGAALKAVLNTTSVYMIKPNLDELRQLLGRSIPDHPHDIAAAVRPLYERAEIIVVSRGENGALLLTRDQAFQCRHQPLPGPVVNTVGCGDYLLAGIAARLPEGKPEQALADGVRAAAARACGLTQTTDWNRLQKEISLDLQPLHV